MLIIVDYGLGNLNSVLSKIKRLKHDVVVSSRVDDIAEASKLILPGVGCFLEGFTNIKEGGILDILHKKITQDKIPTLGICLGMQLFMEHSQEGDCPGLGYIPGMVKRFNYNNFIPGLRVPHMGWNNITIKKESILLRNIPEGARFYFAHSFYVECDEEYAAATTDYGLEFTSVIEKGNIFGTQFHPEKSRLYGLQVIDNFLRFT